MKKLSLILTLLGLFLVAVFTGADLLGLGEDTGIGAAQILGILAGGASFLLGIGLMTVKWDGEISVAKYITPSKILDLPITFWILITFFATYAAFFLFPVFFSRANIYYLTKYIPNAFIANIGHDINITVNYIESWLGANQSPYTGNIVAYPPLAVAVFATFSIIGYPAYFKLISWITLSAYLIVTLVTSLLLKPKRNQALMVLLFVSGLFSYGFQFELERGQFNMIAFALCLLAIYIFHFHNKYRYFAYLLFSLSIQLKVYPVFFIVMLIDDWRNWRAMFKRFVGIGLVNFALLFVLGHKIFLEFLTAITNYQNLLSSRYESLSIKTFAYYLSNDVFGAANSSFWASILSAEIFYWMVFAVCLLLIIGYAFFRSERGLNPYLLFICTIAALIIPSVSNDYKLSLLVAPMTLVLCGLSNTQEPKKKALSILLVIVASLAFWITLYPATVKPDFLTRNFPALIVILLSVTALQFLAPYTYDRNA